MQVFIDDQIFRLQRVGGISRYFVELAAAFNADDRLGFSCRLPTGSSANHLLLAAGKARPQRRGGAVWSAARRRLLPPRHPNHVDVVHSTYYLPRYLPRLADVPHAVTVHDMMPEQMPHYFPNGNPHAAKREYVARADVVLCNSAATRDALLETWGPQRAPIIVSPFAASPVFSPEGPRARRPGARRAELLFVGSRGGQKDFGVLPAALQIAGSALSDVAVRCVGGEPFRDTERATLHRFGVADRFSWSQVDDLSLAAHYRSADLVVVTSQAEGFGLPVLEALASGTGVVSSDVPALREVGGDAVDYFTPGDAEHLAETITSVLAQPDDAGQRRRQRLDRAGQFSWARCARQTARAYEMAMANHD